MATIGNEGVTTNAALPVGSQRYIDDGHIAAEDGTVQSITLSTVLDCTQVGNTVRMCIYKGTGLATDTLLTNSDVGERLADSSVDVGGKWLCTWNYTGTKPVIQSGETYGLSCTTGNTRPWYVTTGGTVRAYDGIGTSTTPTDPAGTEDATNSFVIHTYATYTAGSFDGVARRLGLSVGIGL